jgi:hypothetical protein
MNCKTVLMEVAAFLAAALILNLPVAGATQINIYRNIGGDNWIKWDDVDIYPGNLVDKDLAVINSGGSPFWSSPKIVINISNTSMAKIEAVHVYKCKNLSPEDCVKTKVPEMRTVVNNSLNMEIGWGDASQIITSCSLKPSSCLEVANLLFLFRIRSGNNAIWVSLWDRIERDTYDFSVPYLFEYSIGEIDLRAKSLDFLIPIRNFLQARLTVPFNPTWVSSVIFPGSSLLYELGASSSELRSGSPSFYATNYTGNRVYNTTKEYSFVFPATGYGTLSPMTMYLNPNFTCGMYGCEGGLGETSSTCCYDCGCSGGYYCDGGISGTCKLESLISLKLHETPVTVITNCNEDHVINVTAGVNNAPSGVSLIGSKYKLGGIVYTTTCKEILPAVYRCPVTVPAATGCQEGEYRTGPNYLNLTIGYSNGPKPVSKTLTVQFPDVVVGSYTCGQKGCESALGENSANCCYDCGCSGGYCDVPVGAEPRNGTCRQDVSVNDLWIAAKPTHFYTHGPASDSVYLNIQIRNAPTHLNVAGTSCGMECYADGYSCSSTCDVTCAKAQSSDPNVYNASCALNFRVNGYNRTRDYSLIPTLNASVTYTNGSSGQVVKTLSRIFSTISIGSSWCGDYACGPDENSRSCCYDCPCSDGYYCDTSDTGAPTAGDSCRPENGIGLVIDDVNRTGFEYPDVSHHATVEAHIENVPRGLADIGYASCRLGGGDLFCDVDCKRTGDSAGSHGLNCSLSIPIIDYKTSEFYDQDSKRIVLRDNTMNYSITFNNGSGMISKDLEADLPDITIDVKPRCGSGPGYFGFEERCSPYNTTLACEEDLGETYDSCCCDCQCPEKKYCVINDEDPGGICKRVSTIRLNVLRFDPDPIKCEIDFTGKTCVFYKPLSVEVEIKPDSDYGVVSASYDLGDGETRSMYCLKHEEIDNRFLCSFYPMPLSVGTGQNGTPSDGNNGSDGHGAEGVGNEMSGSGEMSGDGLSLSGSGMGTSVGVLSFREEGTCSVASHCMGLPHDGCAGQWECSNGECEWECEQPGNGTGGSGEVARNIGLSLTVSTRGLLNPTAITKDAVFRVEQVKSDALKTYEEKLAETQSATDEYNTIKYVIYGILGFLAGWCTCSCIKPCPVTWPHCQNCWTIFACISSVLLPVLSQLVGQTQALKAQYKAMQAVRNPAGLDEEMNAPDTGISSYQLTLIIGSVAASVICFMGIGKGISLATKMVTTSTFGTMFQLLVNPQGNTNAQNFGFNDYGEGSYGNSGTGGSGTPDENYPDPNDPYLRPF